MFTIVNGIQVDLANYLDNERLIRELEIDDSFRSDVSFGFEKELSLADDEQSGDVILDMVICREIEKRTEKSKGQSLSDRIQSASSRVVEACSTFDVKYKVLEPGR